MEAPCPAHASREPDSGSEKSVTRSSPRAATLNLPVRGLRVYRRMQSPSSAVNQMFPSALLHEAFVTAGLKSRVTGLILRSDRFITNIWPSDMEGIIPSGTFLPMPPSASGEPVTST